MVNPECDSVNLQEVNKIVRTIRRILKVHTLGQTGAWRRCWAHSASFWRFMVKFSSNFSLFSVFFSELLSEGVSLTRYTYNRQALPIDIPFYSRVKSPTKFWYIPPKLWDLYSQTSGPCQVHLVHLPLFVKPRHRGISSEAVIAQLPLGRWCTKVMQ